MQDVVIVSACRTAIGAFGGSLKDTNGASLAGSTMQEAVHRAGIDSQLIDDVRYGCCKEHHDTLNVSRVAALMAGIPESVPAATVNRVCISGMEAVVSGMAMIQAQMAEVVLAGGVEHMSGVPYALPGARWGYRLQDNRVEDQLIHALHAGSHHLPLSGDAPLDISQEPFRSFVGQPYIMGHTAEFVAHKYGFSREELDEIALRSHNNVQRSTEQGEFQEEIVPVEVPKKKKETYVFDQDEHFRPNLSLDDLKKLRPAFIPNGTVTAGNSSGINDGAAGMVIMSASKAKELGLTPLAAIRAVGKGACHPAVMGLSPVPAVKDLLHKSQYSLPDFELIELNEAFAAQYLGCERELDLNREITNINGSGIGIGHPIGATGARIMVTLLHALRRKGFNLGLATLCGGGGVSMACALEIL